MTPAIYTSIKNSILLPLSFEIIETWDTTANIDGEYIIKLSTKDKISNMGFSEIHIILDRTLPVAEITYPSMDTVIEDDYIILEGTANDVNFVQYSILLGMGDNPEEWIEIETYTGPVSDDELHNIDLAGIWGIINIKLVVRDKAGNMRNDVVKIKRIPPLWINEVNPQALAGQDWAEIYCYNKTSINLSDFILTDLDGIDTKLADGFVIVASNQYIVVHWGEGTDETYDIGDINGNGYIDLYVSDEGLSEDDDQLVLIINDLIVDAVIWSDYDGNIVLPEVEDANSQCKANEWVGTFSEIDEQDAVQLGISEESSIARKPYIDNNSKNDWLISPVHTAGIPNDIIPPRTTISAGDPKYVDITLYARYDTPFALTAVDDLVVAGDGNGLGVDNTYYNIDNNSPIIYSVSFAIPDEGEHQIYYYSDDIIGNIETPNTLSLTIDNTPPITAISIADTLYTEEGIVYANEDVTVELNPEDQPLLSSGVQYTKYRTNNGIWLDYAGLFNLPTSKEGTFIIEYYSIDNVNNEEQVKSQTVVNKNSYFPAIAYSGDKIYTVFEDTRNRNYDIYFREKLDGASAWSDDINISAPYFSGQYPGALVNSYKPDIAVNDNSIYVTWHYIKDSISMICLAKRALSGSGDWIYYELPLAEIPDLLCYSPKIACYDEYIHLVWSLYNNTTSKYEIYYMRMSDYGASLDLEKFISSTVDNYHAIPSDIVVNNSHNISVVYEMIDAVGIKKLAYLFSENNGDTWVDKDIRAELVKEEDVVFFAGAGEGMWTKDIVLPEGYTIYEVTKNENNAANIIADNSYQDGNIYHVVIDYSSYKQGIIQHEMDTQSECIPIFGSDVCYDYYAWNEINGNIFAPEAVLDAEYIIKAYKDDIISGDIAYNDTFSPKLAIDRDNNIVIVWADNRDSNAEIYSKSYIQNEDKWKEKQRITAENSVSVMPSINAGSKGFDIVWQEHRDGNREVYFKNSPDSGLTWSSKENISDNPDASMVPVIGENFDNQNIIVWQDDGRGNFEVISTIDDGRDLAEPTSSLAELSYVGIELNPSNLQDADLLNLGQIIGNAYNVEHISGLNQFNTPFILKFYYTDNDVVGIDENSLIVFAYNETEGEWEPAVIDPSMTEKDINNNSISISLDYLSKFVILSPDDLSAPVTTIAYSQPESCENNICYINGTTLITLSAIDPGAGAAGIDYIEYRLNNEDWAKYITSFAITLPPNQYYSFEYRSIDKAGNIEVINSLVLGLDTDVPGSTIIAQGLLTADYHASINNTYSIESLDFMSGVDEKYII